MARKATMTPAQQRCFETIAQNQRTEPHGPTIREVAALLGVRSSFGVQRNVDALRKLGLVQDDKGRGLVLSRACKPVTRAPVVKPGGKLL
jgi:Mn-dependent DtxR family transcriptional regulator